MKRRIVIALYNYTAREDTDVSFVKGDRMEVIDDTESDWWRVVHITTRQEGLIPWNFVAEERSVNSEEYVYLNNNNIIPIINKFMNFCFHLAGFLKMYHAKKPTNCCCMKTIHVVHF